MEVEITWLIQNGVLQKQDFYENPLQITLMVYPKLTTIKYLLESSAIK